VVRVAHMITNGYYCGNIRLGLREVRESGSARQARPGSRFGQSFFGGLAVEVMCQRRAEEAGGSRQPRAPARKGRWRRILL